MNHKWQFKIEHRIDQLAYWVYMCRKDGEEIEFVCHDGTLRRVKQGESTGEILPLIMLEDLSSLQSLIDEAEERGVKTEKHDYMRGELEATKRHLEDVRKVAKL